MEKDLVNKFGEVASRLESLLKAARENVLTNPQKTIQSVCDQSKALLELARKIEDSYPESFAISVRSRERELLGWAADFIFSHFRESFIRVKRASKPGSKEVIEGARTLIHYIDVYTLPYYQRIERADLFIQTLLYVVYEVAGECPGFKDAKSEEERDTASRIHGLLKNAKMTGVNIPDALMKKFALDQIATTISVEENPITSGYATMLDKLEQENRLLVGDKDYIRLRRRLLSVSLEHWQELQRHLASVGEERCACGGEVKAEEQRLVEDEGHFYDIILARCVKCSQTLEKKLEIDIVLGERATLIALKEYLMKKYSISLS